MRKIMVKVYRYQELPENVRQKVRDEHAAAMGYAWEREAFESVTALAAHFGAKIEDYSFDYFGSIGPERLQFHFFDPCDDGSYEMKPAEIKRRLAKLGRYNKNTGRGDGDCVLTGFCMDEDAIDGFRQAWRAGIRDLSKLLHSAFGSWLKAAQEDCAGQYSDKQFAENADANYYEYYEDGQLVEHKYRKEEKCKSSR